MLSPWINRKHNAMNEETCAPSGVALSDTGFGYTLSLIGGKYKMLILYALAENKVLRHNELKRHLDGIAFKTLSVALKELEVVEQAVERQRRKMSAAARARISAAQKKRWAKQRAAEKK